MFLLCYTVPIQLLTLGRRLLLEKLIVAHLVKKFPAAFHTKAANGGGTLVDAVYVLPERMILRKVVTILNNDTCRVKYPNFHSNNFFLLRHYNTSRKVAGSIPDEVIGFFN
jgi:hypothetical protein